MADKKKRTRKPTEGQAEPSILDKFLKDEDTEDDATVLASLLDENGNLIGDYSMPEAYEEETVATQMVDHLYAYKQAEIAHTTAKNQGDHKRRKELFDSMRFNQITIAIIQQRFPNAKQIADDIMETKVSTVRAQRDKFLDDE